MFFQIDRSQQIYIVLCLIKAYECVQWISKRFIHRFPFLSLRLSFCMRSRANFFLSPSLPCDLSSIFFMSIKREEDKQFSEAYLLHIHTELRHYWKVWVDAENQLNQTKAARKLITNYSFGMLTLTQSVLCAHLWKWKIPDHREGFSGPARFDLICNFFYPRKITHQLLLPPPVLAAFISSGKNHWLFA